MKPEITIGPDSGAIYIRLSEGAIWFTEEVPNRYDKIVNVDKDSRGEIVGIEIV